jgi:hypothetical protein
MNIAKFQFCVNHVDPSIVKQGLTGFADQVLRDHGKAGEYGYCGRSESYDVEDILYESRGKHYFADESGSSSSNRVVGLLATYLTSSPKVEELFVLWSIGERSIDKELCAAHMHAFAVILHCARCDRSMHAILHNIATRILDDSLSSLRSQLAESSSSVELIHATLGLLVEMSCLSRAIAQKILENIVFSEPKYNAQTTSVEVPLSSEFMGCLKHGNAVKWTCRGPTQEETDPSNPRTFETDTRYLVYLLLLQSMISIDEQAYSGGSSSSGKMIHQLLSGNHSPWKKLLSGISRDALSTVRLVLIGLVEIQNRSSARTDGQLTDVCMSLVGADISVLQKIVHMYKHKMKKMQDTAHKFLLALTRQLSSQHHFTIANSMIRTLEGHAELRHREVRIVLDCSLCLNLTGFHYVLCSWLLPSFKSFLPC